MLGYFNEKSYIFVAKCLLSVPILSFYLLFSFLTSVIFRMCFMSTNFSLRTYSKHQHGSYSIIATLIVLFVFYISGTYCFLLILDRFLEEVHMWTSVTLFMICHLAQNIQEFITHLMGWNGYCMTLVEHSNITLRCESLAFSWLTSRFAVQISVSAFAGLLFEFRSINQNIFSWWGDRCLALYLKT